MTIPRPQQGTSETTLMVIAYISLASKPCLLIKKPQDSAEFPFPAPISVGFFVRLDGPQWV